MRINATDINNKQGMFLYINSDDKTDKNDKSDDKIGRNIFGGNFNQNLDINAKVEQKRKQAQKQAMKLIMEAVNKDKEALDARNELTELRDQKVAEVIEGNGSIKSFEEQKEQLRQQYGVAEDSDEQKDLELLQKYQNSIGGANSENFTEEELDRLRELQNAPRTEYQNRVLEINQAQVAAQNKVNKSEQEIRALSAGIYDMKSEQLKSKTMLEAKESADNLIEVTEDEIVGMLVQDAKDKVDEKAEEEKEKAEEVAEKKEEQEERLEEQKEKREDLEELLIGAVENSKLKQEIEAVQSVPNSVADAKVAIFNMLEEQGLVADDLKGIEIDLNF